MAEHTFSLETARRDLLEVLPALAKVYGLKPWDVEQLTGFEISAFLEDLERIQKAEAAEQQQIQRQLGEAERIGIGG